MPWQSLKGYAGKERKGKEGFPFTRTRGLVAYWRGPISEDAMRLLGREQLASRGSSGTCGVMANHTKSITRTLPAPKVCGDAGIRTTDHTGRRLLARVQGPRASGPQRERHAYTNKTKLKNKTSKTKTKRKAQNKT